jgi:hypothetical protein
MPKTIIQKVVFRNTNAKNRYDLYTNSRLHTKIAGGLVKIIAKTGMKFSAHGNYFSDKNIHLIKNRQIVQTRRAVDWKKTDSDSIIMINLEQKVKRCNPGYGSAYITDKETAGIKKGWID